MEEGLVLDVCQPWMMQVLAIHEAAGLTVILGFSTASQTH